MTFLAVLLAFLIVQYWGFGDKAQQDQWYQRWCEKAYGFAAGWTPELRLLGQLLPPVALLYVVLCLFSFSSLLQLLVAVPVLLFSFGRGDYSEWVKGYTEAYHRGDNTAAAEYCERLGVKLDPADGWGSFHRQVLRQAGYRGFERMFAAIFWFACLGPMGALLYRLAHLSQQAAERDNVSEVQPVAERLLWLMEWPAVRVLGFSFALTGNFVGCFQRWNEKLLCSQSSTPEVMEHYIHGALNVNGQELVLEQVTEQEVEGLLPLLSRTLVFWLCVLAILAILT